MLQPQSSLLTAEMLALYREARASTDADFKLAGLSRAQAWLPMTSASWVNGVLIEGRPCMHDASSIGLKPGFWEAMATLIDRGFDPLGPAMFNAPGHSLVTLPEFYPPEFRSVIHSGYDIHCALTGLWLDTHTGNFSAVCFYRNTDLPVFSERERLLHEQLLPHWLESLALHRVLRATRATQSAWQPGQTVGVVERSGLIHHAPAGFGERIKAEWPEWNGSRLPTAMLRALDHQNMYASARLQASWQPTDTTALMLVTLHPEHSSPPTPGLNALGTSLQQAEHHLERLTKSLLDQQRQQAVAQERQRIMRELHDGVGAQLVSLLHCVHSNTLNPRNIEQTVQAALNELRMAVNTMQDDSLNVASALADMRHQLQPRLESAGMQMTWSLPPDLAEVMMTPSEAFQLQRIVLEAITNAIKHARAQHLHVHAKLLNTTGQAGLEMEICDDGIGLPPSYASATGMGLRNMRHRAQALGAELTIAPGQQSGTMVRLRWCPA